jgi:hypothetical protein
MTPAAWLARLERRLADQQREVQLYEDYYDGRHRMAFATHKFRESFGALFKALADNWCPIVVDAAVERLTVEGFRFGPDEEADDEAWDIWQDNGLDAESVMAHTEAVKNGRAYVMVAPAERDSDSPAITVEHPSQCIVEHLPGNRRRRVAALKKWRAEDEHDYANVYLPEYVAKFRSKEPRRHLSGVPGRDWVRREDDPGGPNPLGVVPLIPLYNNPSMLRGGRSDLATAIPLQDAINKEIADMLVASEFAAFPQRVFMGIEVPTLPGTETPDPAFELKASIARILALEGEHAKIGEFAAADLGNYVKAIATLLQHLSAQTRTPPHYLLAEMVNISGDALRAAEVGLVARVKRKQIGFGESWEEAMRLAFGLRGKADRARATNAETIWGNCEYRSDGELVDAAVKLRLLGWPLEALWERVGATQEQIKRFKNLMGLPERTPPGEPTPEVPVPGGSDDAV